MVATPELRAGWVGSIGFHLLLLLLFILSRVPTTERKPEFIELSFGGTPPRAESAVAPNPPASRSELPAAATPVSSPARTTRTTPPSRIPVELPASRSVESDVDRLVVPQATKLAPTNAPIDAAPVSRTPSTTGGSRGDIGSTVAGGGKDQPAYAGTGARGTSVGPGFGEGPGVGYLIEWGSAGKRKLLSGNPPKYPEGVNVEARIAVRAIVLPDGKVQSVQPVERADNRLENAAMKEVRLWIFEPLPAGSPQVNQPCVISFLFRLR